MNRTFQVHVGPHAPQLCIQAHDLTPHECQLLRRVVCNIHMDSPDYKAKKGAGPFLQGYQEPYGDGSDGWVLVEFWSDDRAAIDRFVGYVNGCFAREIVNGKNPTWDL